MKISKKANSYILNQVLKINPKISKNTSYDEAYEILMENWDLVGTIETLRTGLTKFKLYREDEVIKIYEWDNVFDSGDWNWTTIFHDVLEDIIKNKLYKPPKKKKRSLKK
jgi:hypothetical protein